MWPRSGFLPILRSLCLPLRSTLKRLGRVFVSAWVSFVCILQKNLRLCSRFYFCLLICLLASGIKPVFAQQYLTMTVSGAGAPVEYANGYYSYWDDLNGRPMYTGNTAEGVWCDIYWSGNLWAIDCDTINLEFYSNENVASPEQVSLWHDGGYGASSMPSIVASSWDEPTLTPTFHPLFPTQTPRPPGDYTCPGYQPIGAGTVTPAADWLLKCGQCITPIPRYTWPTAPAIPTADWEFTTPTPAGTPGIPTPTSVANAVVCRSMNMSEAYTPWIDEYLQPGVLLTRYKSMIWGSGNMNTGYNWNIMDQNTLETVIGVHVYGTSNITVKNEGNPGWFVYNWQINEYNLFSGEIEITESNVSTIVPGTKYVLNSNDAHVNILSVPIPPGTSRTDNFDIKFNMKLNRSYVWQDLGKVGWFNTYVAGDTQSGNVTWSIEYKFEAYPSYLNTGCSTIPTAVPDDPDAPFKLPYIGVGEGQGISLGGWTIPTGWLQIFFPNAPDSFTLPGIELLFLPVEFGSLNLFGIPIDLDAMAFLMAGVVLIRILRS